jgi:hypothetical protein
LKTNTFIMEGAADMLLGSLNRSRKISINSNLEENQLGHSTASHCAGSAVPSRPNAE